MTALASERVRGHRLQEANRPVVVENISIQCTRLVQRAVSPSANRL